MKSAKHSSEHKTLGTFAKKVGTFVATAAFVFSFSIYIDPIRLAHATPTPAEIAARITQLSGLSADEIDQIYAAEQAPHVLLIAYEVTIPVVLEGRVGYLLIRVAATGEWIRMLIDTAEWKNDFRPYLEAQGVTIHRQPYGTIDDLAPATEAAGIAAGGSIPGAANANLILYGDVSGPQGSPVAAPQPHVEPVPPLSTAADSDRIGTTGADFSVNETGNATYSVPIVSAEGTAGLSPKITLDYVSNADNGVAGIGWSIGGLSSITRCRQTTGQDNSPRAITWNSSDRFCLDGQRLIVESGAYGAANSVYRTELDSFAVVTAKGNVAGGPDYFEVRRRDGSLAYYGESPNDAANQSAKLKNSAGQVLSWSIREKQDSVGNPIWFEYTTATGTQNVSDIKFAYGSLGGPSGHGARIEFSYEDRDDPISGYLSGHYLSNGKRLSSIRSYNNPADELIREYRLEYQTAAMVPTDRLSRLASVQECVGVVCLPKTRFSWRLPDSYPYYNLSGSFTMANSNHALMGFKPADINGDGKMDLVWMEGSFGSDPSDYQPRLNYAISTGNSFTQTAFVNGGLEIVYPKVYVSREPYFEALDYNADGRQDVAVYDYSASRWKVYLATPDGASDWKLNATPIVLPQPTVASAFSAPLTKFFDVNADGLVDAVAMSSDGPVVRYLEVDPGKPVNSSSFYRFGDEVQLNAVDTGYLDEFPDFPPPYDYYNAQYGYQHLSSSNPDFNGDGRVDFFMGGAMGPYSSGYYSPPTRFGIGVHVASGADEFEFYEIVSDGNPYMNFKRTQAVDLNNDGLADLVYPEGSTSNKQFYYRINYGDGNFGAPVLINESNLGTHSNGNSTSTTDDPQFVDWNSDGYLDLMWKRVQGGGSIRVAYWNPADNDFDPSVYVVSALSSGKEYASFPDMNGDGVADIVKIDSRNNTGVVTVMTRMEGFGLGDANVAVNRIEAITNGLGLVTSVEYESLAQTSNYERLNVDTTASTTIFCEREPGFEICYEVPYQAANPDSFYAALNGDWDLPTGTQTLGKYQPVLELMSPMYVVTRVSSAVPAAGTSPGSININATSSMQYYYGEAKVQASGRGFLGFERLRTVNEQTGVQTTTTYRQDWPFIGQPLKSEVRSADGQLLARSTGDAKILQYTTGLNTNQTALSAAIDTVSTGGTAALGAINVIQSASVEETYDLKDNGATQGVLLGTLQTTASYDVHGNREVVTKTNRDGAGSVVKQSTTENDYFDTADLPGYLGKLQTNTVTVTRPGVAGTHQRKMSFTYSVSGSSRLKLATETNEPDRPEYRTVIAHDYDDLGNRVQSSTTGAGETRCNVDTVDYDSRGRYVKASYDCLGRKIEEAVARNKFGGVEVGKTFVGGNSVTTTMAFGAHGRRYFERVDDGSWKKIYSTSEIANCPSSAAYKTTTTVGGGGESEVCYDVLGSEVRKLTRGFDGGWDVQDTVYDELGRIRYKSEPYDLGAPANQVHWTAISYDILGRATGIILPDGSSAETTYEGLKTTSKNDLDQVRIEIRNVVDEVTDVYDNLGGRTRYAYDHEGNLAQVTDNAGNVTTLEYDDLGRKTDSYDPDRGHWQYEYSYFNELEKQTDAKNQTQTMTYDGLGRMRTRVDRDSSGAITSNTTWTYDTAAFGLGQLGSVQDSQTGYTRAITYDNLGRVSELITSFDGSTYSQQRTYDQFARTFQVFDASGDGSYSAQGIVHYYNSYGHLETVGDAVEVGGSPRTIYRQITEMNARGQVTREVLGNGVTTVNSHDSETGRLLGISGTSASGYEVQNLQYFWDSVGNLSWRKEQSGTKNLTENFTYDALNRLKSQTVAGQAPVTVTYDDDHIGNIKSKSDVAGTYVYGAGTAGPHAVTGIGTASYGYDANGNNVSGDGRTIDYTVFDKPSQIVKSGHTTRFSYAPNRSRYKRVDIGTSGTTTTRYVGNVELIDRPDGTHERRRYVAGVAIETLYFGTNTVEDYRTTLYQHKDHLGSLDVLTDTTGAVIKELSFDAWGQRRNASNWQALSQVQLAGFDHLLTTRGFTDHEMLDEVGLVHMNGRIYDPKIGRFMQADPFVQEPLLTQSLNRYSYSLNNPLNATDPSGFFFKKLLRIVVAIVAAYYTFGAVWSAATQVGGWATTSVTLAGTTMSYVSAPILAGAVAGAAAGAVSGAILTGTLKGAVQGAFSGAIGGGLVGHFGHAYSLKRVAADSLAGGIQAEINGGRFKDGLLFSALASGMTFLNVKLREYEKAHSQRTPQQVGPNNKGFRGIDGKVGGERISEKHWAESGAKAAVESGAVTFEEAVFDIYLPHKQDEALIGLSPLGGFQGSENSMIFWIEFDPNGHAVGQFTNYVIEGYAGTHDFLNHWYFYKSNGMVKDIHTFVGKAFGGLLNATNVAIASPVVLPSLVPDYMRHNFFYDDD